MVWPASPPTNVSQLRDQLVACATCVAAGLVQANWHYPKAAITTDDAASPDDRPLGIITQHSQRTKRYAETGIPSASFRVVIYADLEDEALETLAEGIKADLMAQQDGLAFQEITFDPASDPIEGAAAAAHSTPAKAAASTRCIILDIQCGFSA